MVCSEDHGISCEDMRTKGVLMFLVAMGGIHLRDNLSYR
jgi:hypothetical protein